MLQKIKTRVKNNAFVIIPIASGTVAGVATFVYLKKQNVTLVMTKDDLEGVKAGFGHMKFMIDGTAYILKRFEDEIYATVE